jgi:phosphatidylglycerophosphate synthase
MDAAPVRGYTRRVMSETTADGAPSAGSSWTFERCVKHVDVEELVDLHFHRRLAFLFVVKPLEHGPRWITPTVITLVSALFVFGAGAVFFAARYVGMELVPVGGALLLVSVVFDCADGMVARLRGGGTRFGMLLDGAVDQVGGWCVWFGLCWAHGALYGGWWTWPLMGTVLASALVHVILYDGYKNNYVRHLEPDRDPTPPEDYGTLTPLERFFARGADAYYTRVYPFLAKYVGGQEDALMTRDPGLFRRHFERPMRLMSFMGLGTTLAFIYVAAFLNPISPHLTYWVCVGGVSGVANVLMVLGMVSWKRAERSVRNA